MGIGQNVGIILKSPREISKMRNAGHVAATVLDMVARAVKPGKTTGQLNEIAVSELKKTDAKASFLGYRGFPALICISLNSEVVHGIPGKRIICEGDIVSLDFGAYLDGFHGDCAITVAVGSVSEEARKLIDSAEGALREGISAAIPGKRLGSVSAAIQNYAESRGFSVVKEYVGHGIGRDLHEDPQVPNFGIEGEGPVLKKGMTLALEPMLNAGTWRTAVAGDKWTVVTADGELSAHFEHTIVIQDNGAEILTGL